MAYFHIKLEVQSGGYEKHTHHNIVADTKQKAMLQAFADESHDNAEMQADGEWHDLGGEFIYTIQNCDEITEEQSKMLDSLRMYVSEYTEDEILNMLDEDAECRDIDTLLSYLS